MPTLAWACETSVMQQHAHASVGMAPVWRNDRMKGIQGLIVAVGLGVTAAILNYFYLHNSWRKKLNGLLHRPEARQDRRSAASGFRPTI